MTHSRNSILSLACTICTVLLLSLCIPQNNSTGCFKTENICIKGPRIQYRLILVPIQPHSSKDAKHLLDSHAWSCWLPSCSDNLLLYYFTWCNPLFAVLVRFTLVARQATYMWVAPRHIHFLCFFCGCVWLLNHLCHFPSFPFFFSDYESTRMIHYRKLLITRHEGTKNWKVLQRTGRDWDFGAFVVPSHELFSSLRQHTV